MHELSICLSLLDQVAQLARRHRASAISAIRVEIGPLSGVEPELLRNAWPLAAAGTIAADALLVIDEAAVVVRCTACGCESPASPNRLVCRECGDFRTRLVSGDELILQRVVLGRTPDGDDDPIATPVGKNAYTDALRR